MTEQGINSLWIWDTLTLMLKWAVVSVVANVLSCAEALCYIVSFLFQSVSNAIEIKSSLKAVGDILSVIDALIKGCVSVFIRYSKVLNIFALAFYIKASATLIHTKMENQIMFAAFVLFLVFFLKLRDFFIDFCQCFIAVLYWNSHYLCAMQLQIWDLSSL